MKITDGILSGLLIISEGRYKGCYKKGSTIYKIQESCKTCGEKYLANVNYLKKGKGLFCCHKCQMTGKNNPFYGKKHSKETKKKQGFSVCDNPATIKYWLNKGYSRSEATVKLKNNNRKNSQYCEEYWLSKGYTKKESIDKIGKIQSGNGNKSRKNGSLIPTQLEYWLSKGYTNKQAKLLLKDRQTTFSKDICIKKYGEEEGLKVWKDRQEKWLSNFTRLNYSKISQELFWSIYSDIKNDFKEIYFAQLGKRKGKDTSGKNYEYKLDIGSTFCKPDFLIKDINRIIEFDGDYWHGEVKGNIQRDKIRDEGIINKGYEILHIKERDYKLNPQKIIRECKEFIYEDK